MHLNCSLGMLSRDICIMSYRLLKGPYVSHSNFHLSFHINLLCFHITSYPITVSFSLSLATSRTIRLIRTNWNIRMPFDWGQMELHGRVRVSFNYLCGTHLVTQHCVIFFISFRKCGVWNWIQYTNKNKLIWSEVKLSLHMILKLG